MRPGAIVENEVLGPKHPYVTVDPFDEVVTDDVCVTSAEAPATVPAIIPAR